MMVRNASETTGSSCGALEHHADHVGQPVDRRPAECLLRVGVDLGNHLLAPVFQAELVEPFRPVATVSLAELVDHH